MTCVQCLTSVGLAAWLGLASTAFSQAHTFTDTSGRTMVADIMDATETTVKVRRDDDQVFELTLDQLSGADRAHVAAWRLKRALAFGGIAISAHRVRLESEHTQTDSSTKTTESWCYKFSVTNHSRAALAGVTVEYRVFYIDDEVNADRDELPLQRQTGRINLGELAAGATAELQTAVVTLRTIQLKPGHRYTGTAKRKVEDSLAGLWVRALDQGEILHEFASPTTLLKSETW
jgi:hypothetical protein